MNNDSITLTKIMSCKTCTSDHLRVAVSTEGDLVMVCHNCDKIVAVLEKWPDEEATKCDCEICKVERELLN